MAMLSGSSGSRVDIPPFATCDGRPLQVRSVNLVGMRRQKFSPELRAAIKQAYVYIYRSGLNNTQAMEKIEEQYSHLPELLEIVAFFRSSKRGIARGYTAGTADDTNDGD